MKIIRFLINFVLVVVTVSIIAVVSPMIFGYKMIVIESGSMEPVLPVNSVCYIHQQDIIHQNDIVTYITGDKDEIYVTHRVIDVNADGSYIVKGDNSEMEDKNPIKNRDIVGVTRFNVPKLGIAVKFLSTTEGKLLAIISLVVLLIFSELADKTIKSSKSAVVIGRVKCETSKLSS